MKSSKKTGFYPVFFVGNLEGQSTDILLTLLVMLTITPECIRFISNASDAAHTLAYLGNLYQRETTFSLSQKTEAERHWCHLTDNTSNIYLLVSEPHIYSLWVLVAPSPLVQRSLPNSISIHAQSLQPVGRAVPNLAIHLLQSLWLIIADLGGIERAKAFGQNVITSDLPIDSESDLQTCLRIMPPPIDIAELDRGRPIIERFQQLARLQVGAGAIINVVDLLPIAEVSPSKLF